MLRRACDDATSWPDGTKIAVNLSPVQFKQTDLFEIIQSALANSGLPPQRLEIEITESVLMQNTATTLNALHRLHELGIRVSMDDFGTGYSSLSNLRLFPFDKIKIDRSFVSGLPTDKGSAAIVRAVAALANSLNMTTTAEGVETAAQRDRCRRLGCTEMQGFLFSAARSAEEIALILGAKDMPAALSA